MKFLYLSLLSLLLFSCSKNVTKLTQYSSVRAANRMIEKFDLELPERDENCNLFLIAPDATVTEAIVTSIVNVANTVYNTVELEEKGKIDFNLKEDAELTLLVEEYSEYISSDSVRIEEILVKGMSISEFSIRAGLLD